MIRPTSTSDQGGGGGGEESEEKLKALRVESQLTTLWTQILK